MPRSLARAPRLRLESLDARVLPNAAPVPQLNSKVGAAHVLYLDFDGHHTNSVPFPKRDADGKPTLKFEPFDTPAFTLDGSSSFSAAELTCIRNIWSIVAEDYAPFDINVTTVEPSVADFDRPRYAARIVVGGTGSWYTSNANTTGVAPIGAYADNVGDGTTGYCFSVQMDGKEVPCAVTISHESGHLFGLDHQSQYTGATKTQEYYEGTLNWGPLMGPSQSKALGTWWKGPTSAGVSVIQDDIEVLGSLLGFRADDHGNTAATATAMTVSGANRTAVGLVNSLTDIDAFSFTVPGGSVVATVRPHQPGPNLNPVLELRDAAGALIATANSEENLEASITRNLAAGSYRLFVKSNGEYGRVGQFTLDVTAGTAATPAPRVTTATVVKNGAGAATGVDLTFDRDMNQSSFATADVVSFTGPGGTNLLAQVTGGTWQTARTIRVNFSARTAAGSYSLVVGPQITSTGGVAMDQDADGAPGEATADRYTATFQVSATTPAGDSFEGNDTFGAAASLGALGSRTVTGLSVHTPNNDDYYRFVAGATGPGTVSISFSHAAGDLDLFVYNSAQGLIGSSTDTADAEAVSVTLVAGQTYYVRVIGYNGATNPNYSLVVSGPGYASDANEPNGTQATATNLGTTSSVTVTRQSIATPNDNDWFRFTPAATADLTITLDYNGQFGEIGGLLYDDLGIPTNGLFGENGGAVTNRFVAGRTYYILIASTNDGYNPNYTLTIGSGRYGKDRFDATGNDTFAAATDLGTAAVLTQTNLSLHNTSDQDFYRFQAQTAGTATVSTASPIGTPGDVDLFVYDANQTLISSSNQFGNDEAVSFPVVPGQTYYVKVVGDEGRLTPQYALTVTTAASPGPGPGSGPARVFAAGGVGGAVTVYTAGAGGVFGDGTALASPFPGFSGQIRTATADVNGDGTADTIVVTGPGGPIRLAVISGTDNNTFLVQPFDPFGGDFRGGGFVTAADIDRDGAAEFLVTPDEGGGPRVSIFSLATGAAQLRANFFGIDDPSFRGGARAALGDVDGDGTPDLAVAAGFLGGPRTALFKGTTLFATPDRLISDFFAFAGTDAQTLRNGVFVAAGDVDGDGKAELVFGGGPGGGPRVFILSGALLAAGDVVGAQAAPVANFFVAGNATDRGGVRLAVTNADGDAKADVVAASGEGSAAKIRVYLGASFNSPTEPAAFQDLAVFGGAVLPGGVFVG